MVISKTRSKLVDVARQLFAKKGVEDTTMNDIALASKKGRRTLYTYFKSKEEIYWAVVESEFETLAEEIRQVADQDLPPDEKIIALIYSRLETVKRAVFRNGTLKAEFFRDIWMVETCRKKFDRSEIEMYAKVLEEGNEKGIFDVVDVNMTAQIIHYSLKGIETPFIRGLIGNRLTDEESKLCVERLVYGALKKK